MRRLEPGFFGSFPQGGRSQQIVTLHLKLGVLLPLLLKLAVQNLQPVGQIDPFNVHPDKGQTENDGQQKHAGQAPETRSPARVHDSSPTRSATRSLALRLRLLRRISPTPGTRGLRIGRISLRACPHRQTGYSRGQRQSVLSRRKIRFTIRSSRE